MTRKDFEFEWTRLDRGEKELIIATAIKEMCVAYGDVAPEIHFVEGAIVERKDGDVTGDYLNRATSIEVINIYPDSNSLTTPGTVFDSPWESLRAAYHETEHFLTGGEDIRQMGEAAHKFAEEFAEMKIEELQRKLDATDSGFPFVGPRSFDDVMREFPQPSMTSIFQDGLSASQNHHPAPGPDGPTPADRALEDMNRQSGQEQHESHSVLHHQFHKPEGGSF